MNKLVLKNVNSTEDKAERVRQFAATSNFYLFVFFLSYYSNYAILYILIRNGGTVETEIVDVWM